jgi:hypothetical protein
MPRPVIDLTGKKFNQLIVLKINEIKERFGANWLCECDCGKKTIARGCDLKAGRKKSCGCLSISALRNHCRTTHGLSKTRFYRIWFAMKRRCTEESNEHFKKYYIDRGITLCNEWFGFEKFKSDMYEPYLKHVSEFGEANTSIDRIDNNKGYCTENCRWATRKEQSLNRRNVRIK